MRSLREKNHEENRQMTPPEKTASSVPVRQSFLIEMVGRGDIFHEIGNRALRMR